MKRMKKVNRFYAASLGLAFFAIACNSATRGPASELVNTAKPMDEAPPTMTNPVYGTWELTLISCAGKEEEIRNAKRQFSSMKLAISDELMGTFTAEYSGMKECHFNFAQNFRDIGQGYMSYISYAGEFSNSPRCEQNLNDSIFGVPLDRETDLARAMDFLGLIYKTKNAPNGATNSSQAHFKISGSEASGFKMTMIEPNHSECNGSRLKLEYSKAKRDLKDLDRLL